MGKATGFKEYPRRTVPYRDAAERIADFDEVFTEHRQCGVCPRNAELERVGSGS